MKKTDKNQAEIVRALRQMGCTVQDLSGVGKGCPDLLVGVAGQNILMEIKCPIEGRIKPSQEKWHGEWRGSVHIVKSVDHAVRIVNHARSGGRFSTQS